MLVQARVRLGFAMPRVATQVSGLTQGGSVSEAASYTSAGARALRRGTEAGATGRRRRPPAPAPGSPQAVFGCARTAPPSVAVSAAVPSAVGLCL